MPDQSPSSQTQHETSSDGSPRRHLRRWIAIALAVVFFGFVFYQVLNPFPDQPYIEISHGNHVHYVPKDRNPDISVSDFPMRPPGPNEHITPDGRIVQNE